ncbi:MAG: surface protein [Pirellulaceae bacterium]|nr:MAG: surface protein [Pirellulaceae bacterium]
MRGFGLLVLGVFGCVSLAGVSTAQSPLFDIEVMAVLSKAGCNAGACHGNQNGKGGFRLSLRGEDPDFDYQAITRHEGGRRINRFDPANSLLLCKPLMQVPHEGGKRFGIDSVAYRVLLDWIAAGAVRAPAPRLVELRVEPPSYTWPADQQELALHVEARFADGSVRDVTDMAVYENADGPVVVEADGRLRPIGPGEGTLVVRFLDQQVPVRVLIPFDSSRLANSGDTGTDSSPANYIDTWIDQKLELLGVPSSGMCEDGVFVRRVYLDLIGLLPAAEEVRAFCEDTRPDKRERLVDELLGRFEFAEHWALKWSDLLRNEEKVLDTRGVDVFYEWIRDAIAQDMPLDQIVRQLITARGSTYEVPATNFYRAHRDPFIRAETVARLFLGVRLQCARCHNHPFDRWTLDDYYAWASCFDGIEYEIIKNDRQDKFDQHEFVGEQIVKVKAEGLVRNPRTGREALPRLLGTDRQINPAEQDRLTVVAEWLASPENPWFSRVLANWVFYHLMGRGLVDPLDDFRTTNPPSHPELLEALAQDLAAHQFQLKPLVRRIVLSRAYQRSARPVAGQPEDDRFFARAVVRRLTAEQLLDAQSQVLEAPLSFAGYPPGTRAGQIRGVRRVRERQQRPTEDDRFLRTFGKPDRLLACECERSNELSLKQVFWLTGESLQTRLANSPRVAQWVAREPARDIESLQELYWSALARPPSEEEQHRCLDYLSDRDSRQAAWQDIVWAVLTSREFMFRH